MPNALRARFAIDRSITFLNHGSYGGCPREVLDAQSELRARMESNTIRFFAETMWSELDASRREIADAVGAHPEDLVFVRNASEAVNTVMAHRMPALAPGDEVVTTDHAYVSFRRALEHHARRAGVTVRVARVPFPPASRDRTLDAILAVTGSRTRLALVDHITSPTGLVFPIEAIVRALAERGIDTMVDGAHAPGQVPLDLERLGAAYFLGNLHKWMCAPKGAAIFHVQRDRQDGLEPLVITHRPGPGERPPLWSAFDWPGTHDPTAWLTAGHALRVLASMVPGGLPAVMERNRTLALRTRDRMCVSLGIPSPAPDSMIGAMVAVPLPPREHASVSDPSLPDPLGTRLRERHGIEVPVFSWQPAHAGGSPPSAPVRLLRIANAVHVGDDDVDRLIDALRQELQLA